MTLDINERQPLEILPENLERINKVKMLSSLLSRVSEWESRGMEFACLEEGVEFIIDNLYSLQCLKPSKILLERNDDHMDTDFHTENTIQKVLKFGSRTPKEIKEWGSRVEQIVESTLELFVTLRQDLQRGLHASNSLDNQENVLKSFLAEGLEPDKPAIKVDCPGHCSFEEQEYKTWDKINRSQAVQNLELVPTSLLWKEIHRRQAEHEKPNGLVTRKFLIFFSQGAWNDHDRGSPGIIIEQKKEQGFPFLYVTKERWAEILNDPALLHNRKLKE